jgi:hypothetical protein
MIDCLADEHMEQPAQQRVYEINRMKKAVDACQQFWHHVGHTQRPVSFTF